MVDKELSGYPHRESEPAISVILTVLNEERFLEGAISAVFNCQYSGDIEVIIAVGPSKDQTRAVAEGLAKKNHAVSVIDNPSGRTPEGLNRALAQAKHEIVVRIDGHSAISENYLRRAVATMRETGAVNVGGIMDAQGQTPFEEAVALAMRSPIGVGSSKFHTGGNPGSVDTVYLGVFNKAALVAAGGYDENFTRAQDWELNYRLRKNGGQVWFDPMLKVTYRPRSSLRALAKQYFEYGRWRRVVSRTHKGTINLRYLAPPINLIVNSLALLGSLVNPLLILPTLTYLIALIIAGIALGKNWKIRLRIPIVLIIMHFSWGFGFLTSSKSLVSR